MSKGSVISSSQTHYVEVLNDLGDYCLAKAAEYTIRSENSVQDAERLYHEQMGQAWQRMSVLVMMVEHVVAGERDDSDEEEKP